MRPKNKNIYIYNRIKEYTRKINILRNWKNKLKKKPLYITPPDIYSKYHYGCI
jgi:hypothetical protein